ncbi:MAG TPA: SCO family protein [Opitutales bacterium]|nr:SCO family protein [Opitutales bacterium]
MLNSIILRVLALTVASVAAIAIVGCAPDDPTVSTGTEQVFIVKGWIRGVPDDRETIMIEHEEIPDFMPAMTMPFYLKEASLADGLEVGDAVEFRFVVHERSSYIDEIKKIDPDEMAAGAQRQQRRDEALRARIPRLEVGDLVPSFQLVDQDGNEFETGKFRGSPVAITFIFTRCPVPEFCPWMSKRFSDVQAEIAEHPELKDRMQLLSITIDPEFDTPEVLKNYAEFYTDSTENWTFATGDPDRIDEITTRFAIYIDPASSSGSIDHALGTALVDPEGRLANFWWGNRWTIDQLLNAASATLEDTTN